MCESSVISRLFSKCSKIVFLRATMLTQMLVSLPVTASAMDCALVQKGVTALSDGVWVPGKYQNTRDGRANQLKRKKAPSRHRRGHFSQRVCARKAEPECTDRREFLPDSGQHGVVGEEGGLPDDRWYVLSNGGCTSTVALWRTLRKLGFGTDKWNCIEWRRRDGAYSSCSRRCCGILGTRY